MPLIFGTDAPTASEVDYADIVGVQYEFPDKYLTLVSPGDRFVYYRGSRGAKSGGVGYFGEGIVGDLRVGTKPNHTLAAVLDVRLFDSVVPIRDGAGNYFETASTRGTNWANGVRRVSDSVVDTILLTAGGPDARATGPGFADPVHASAMEKYSVSVVVKLLSAEFGYSNVREMPVNNPGFDIEVTAPSGSLHVEVKGTVLPSATFHLSEGQCRHAELLASRWRLYVVYAIDRGRRTHHVASCTGADLKQRAGLTVEGWRGRLSAGS